MKTMTPDTVFKDKSKLSETKLSGSGIGPQKIQTPVPSSPGEAEQVLSSYFSRYPHLEQFYKMMLHYSRISKSKKDAKDQFVKAVEIFFSALKHQHPEEKDLEQIQDIQKSMENTHKMLDNFLKCSNISEENEYYKAGLAALVVSLL